MDDYFIEWRIVFKNDYLWNELGKEFFDSILESHAVKIGFILNTNNTLVTPSLKEPIRIYFAVLTPQKFPPFNTTPPPPN